METTKLSEYVATQTTQTLIDAERVLSKVFDDASSLCFESILNELEKRMGDKEFSRFCESLYKEKQ